MVSPGMDFAPVSLQTRSEADVKQVLVGLGKSHGNCAWNKNPDQLRIA